MTFHITSHIADRTPLVLARVGDMRYYFCESGEFVIGIQEDSEGLPNFEEYLRLKGCSLRDLITNEYLIGTVGQLVN